MKVEAGKSHIHGTGLFSREAIKKGELIGQFEGRATKENDIHVLWYEEKGNWRALSVTNVLKYANHSKKPNVEVLGREMYAIRKIKKGEEITFDYGDEWQ
ncbi:SET domain-containing protein [Pseudobacteriovorax antillogorgiicola]|uniref:SET domain-containing protein n=1 Tax=Pseudobacteriovorax antillogorgiicola TaxID=1513793 RepID=A0A1Y6CGD2_9BACT|nr:SET domain-containing protein [Pseudobacteriovorax antillogorgiicola]TCS47314.1 hypothetical protein EDD56_12189 [Pseudobacteriovorax antillogorgiicola]SMF62754.1 hypothetical protein SAMN06296036_12189 [Pseudobacteriovorax antillogorgiicola]